MKMRTKTAASLLITAALLLCAFPNAGAAEETAAVSNAVAPAADTESAFWDLPPYSEYRAEHADASAEVEPILIQAADYSRSAGDVHKEDYMGEAALFTPEEGSVEFDFTVPKAGLYLLTVNGAAVQGKQSSIERAVYLDGKMPFQEASVFAFPRTWKSLSGIQTDAKGNDSPPAQEEEKRWTDTVLRDRTGLNTDDCLFYLDQGNHTLRVESVREPYVLRTLTFCAPDVLPSYKEIKAGYDKAGYLPAKEPLMLEAEAPSFKSDSNIYPVSDRTSTATSPYSAAKIRLNCIGGADQWNMPGQWITYTVKPKETGLYHIAMRYKQSFYDGMFVSRRLLINGKTPFSEARNIRFVYNGKWQVAPVGDGENAFEFYFEKGREYEITLEVILGDMASVLGAATNVIASLNRDSQKIVMITGTTLDLYRDYHFDVLIPDVLADMRAQLQALQKIYDEMVASVGGKGQQTAIMDNVLLDLRHMTADPKELPARLDGFKVNLGGLAAWVLEAQKQPLSLDWIMLAPVGQELPKAQNGFSKELWNGVLQFFYSFVIDYYTLDSEGTFGRSVKVWVGSGAISGRDQAQIVRRMINDSFVSQHGINVQLQMVVGGTLLPATLSGFGPDVVLQEASGTPMNLAVRGAVREITDLPGYDRIIKRFDPATLIPYQLEGKTYALPDSFSFPMMFCRMDILSELGMKPPETWEDFFLMVPELKKKNMDVGLPSDMGGFLMLLYQNGIELYRDGGRRVNFDEVGALEQFRYFTDLYSEYGLPLIYNFPNRFRTGEMPIAITDFSTYNMISIFAPEIQGRWSFFPVPGTQKPDGTIDRSVTGGGACSMMMHSCKDPETAWEFMTWWSEAETQTRFAREIESILGPSARYSSANLEAFAQLPWRASDLRSITAQRAFVRGVPEVPGGYMTGRYFGFAFSLVVNNKMNSSEQMRYYTKLIDQEIAEKRAEFGLS
ncbi:MAG: extracellular solute-binding protein [Oscillospiraceae bacterium]|jgi:ABC-type glycerol-3-phosphate transport system substrate-binding protein|nr:extracellular solute-binding protein [Oscillospiraceae bacterium]